MISFVRLLFLVFLFVFVFVIFWRSLFSVYFFVFIFFWGGGTGSFICLFVFLYFFFFFSFFLFLFFVFWRLWVWFFEENCQNSKCKLSLTLSVELRERWLCPLWRGTTLNYICWWVSSFRDLETIKYHLIAVTLRPTQTWSSCPIHVLNRYV